MQSNLGRGHLQSGESSSGAASNSNAQHIITLNSNNQQVLYTSTMDHFLSGLEHNHNAGWSTTSGGPRSAAIHDATSHGFNIGSSEYFFEKLVLVKKNHVC